MEKTIKLKISGMHCASCAMNIDGELEDKGVKEASTSYAKEETKVVFDDSKISIQEMVDAIQGLGYQAVLLGSE